MLKMVVSDLDGTLIHGQNELPIDVRRMLKSLEQKNILFAVASGRKVCELKKIFKDFKNSVIFIACDGSYVEYKRNVLVSEAISKEIIEKLSFEYEGLSDKDGNVVKIIVKNESLSKRYEEYIKNNRLLSLVYDDFGLKEYVKYGINKGTALQKVIRFFDIDKRDIVVFGDNYNDTQMLKFIPNSYAVINAKDNIKRITRYQTEDVCNTVLKLIEGI